ncbi:MAG: hypothetical protein U0441_22665 [Polyangiaceae bacterium]
MTPSLGAKTVPPAPRPASISVEDTAVIGRDAAGKEIFRGTFDIHDDRLRFDSPGSSMGFEIPLRRFPGAHGQAKRTFAVGADGTALVGADDGSLLAVDWQGRPQFQLGVRGPLAEIHARPGSGYELMTDAGRVVLDAASAGPLEPPPGPRAPRTSILRPPAAGRLPWIVLGPNDAWSLEEEDTGPAPRVQSLHHFDGKAWSPVRMEALLATKSVTNGKADFRAESLERGPDGQLVVIGYERTWSADSAGVGSYELRMFEWTGSSFRERRDIAPAFGKTLRDDLPSSGSAVSYAAGPGGREIVCLMERCLAHGLPASVRPPGGKAPVRTAAPGWISFDWLDAFATMGRRATLFAGPSLFRYDYAGLTKDGKKLIDGETTLMKLDAGEYPILPDPYNPPLKDPVPEGKRLTRGLWASSPEDVWVSIGLVPRASALFRWNGKQLSNVPCPLAWVDEIWGSGPNDVWLSGEGVAHYDGHEIRRIPGIPAGPIAGGTADDVWIGNWRVTRVASPQPDLTGTPAATPPSAPPSTPVDVSAAVPSVRVEPVTLVLAGEAPLKTALGVEEGPNGLVWLHDLGRIVEVNGPSARVLHRVAEYEELDCGRCMAPRGAGEGAFLATGPDDMLSLRTLSKGGVEDVVASPDLLAIASAPGGDIWAVSATDARWMPRALVSTPRGLREVVGLPDAAYSSVAVRADDDVWLSGGLTTVRDDVRAQPAGEGILVHYDGHGFTRHRGPEGALLAIAPVGPGEAWAVGYDGGVVHVKDGVAAAYHLERAGNPLRVALRSVAAVGPDDVWIAGDGATLLHWDGKAFSRMDVVSVGADAALTAVAPPRDKAPGWLAGPRGIWRFSRTNDARRPGP